MHFLYGTVLLAFVLAVIHRLDLLIIFKMNKMQRVRLITLRSSIIVNDNPAQHINNPEDEIKSIHSYFVMLRHIFQKNKQVIRTRNEFNKSKKSDGPTTETKNSQKRELCMAITQQCVGIQKNNADFANDFKKKTQGRNYRPYRPKHNSLKVNAKTLHASAPNILPEKDNQFTPIGQKYHECKEVTSAVTEKPNCRPGGNVGTCINFYPRYEQGICSRVSAQLTRTKLKKERRTILTRGRQVNTQSNESESLRSSHKSAYSKQSCISMATEASSIPSPW